MNALENLPISPFHPLSANIVFHRGKFEFPIAEFPFRPDVDHIRPVRKNHFAGCAVLNDRRSPGVVDIPFPVGGFEAIVAEKINEPSIVGKSKRPGYPEVTVGEGRSCLY
ncbi:MAG: hypothetical protein PHP04_05095 [Bacteroidales bacterium]|nr:hypothetical protein [Bacteroidales bacterium]HNW73099.1 hypothetical protein [Bacteroidales bacterium]HPS50288.1 hypothetical protein [Bacteroidales bacterium]